MDSEESENKAKLMKKRNVQLVHEHFEEVLTPLSGSSLFVQWFFNGELNAPNILLLHLKLLKPFAE